MRLGRRLCKLFGLTCPPDVFRNKLAGTIFPTLDFFEMQYDAEGTFQAYDVCVRYGFIRDYISGDLDGEGLFSKLYAKMQSRRQMISPHDRKTFIPLIENVKAHGYDLSNRISVCTGRGAYLLGDGSHRLSCALFFRCPYVSVVRSRQRKNKTRNYGEAWFRANGFDDGEIDAIMAMKTEIAQRFRSKPDTSDSV